MEGISSGIRYAQSYKIKVGVYYSPYESVLIVFDFYFKFLLVDKNNIH